MSSKSVAKDIDVIAPGLGRERRIGGHAIDEAAFRKLADFLGVGAVDEEFHKSIDRTESR
jgi:hypothetical protein